MDPNHSLQSLVQSIMREVQELRAENREIRRRLEEAEETSGC